MMLQIRKMGKMTGWIYATFTDMPSYGSEKNPHVLMPNM